MTAPEPVSDTPIYDQLVTETGGDPLALATEIRDGITPPAEPEPEPETTQIPALPAVPTDTREITAVQAPTGSPGSAGTEKQQPTT